MAALPGIFVVLWSTGFIGARLVLPHSEPLTVLTLRFGMTVALFLPLAWIGRAPWPATRRIAGHAAITGLLLHGLYLGGVFSAIKVGMPAGITSLIVGPQPLLTAVASGPLLGEHVSTRQWLGLGLGFAGVALVLSDKLAPTASTLFDGFGIGAVLLTGLALIGITAGTLYQKRFCAGLDPRTGAVIQFTAAGMALGLLALLLGEDMRIHWTAEFIFGIGWLVVVLSVGAVTLLMILIRMGAAARVASLFYLVPPVTALMAWALFGETLGPLALGGMGVVVVGVALVMRPANR